jgi:hypothetical protein
MRIHRRAANVVARYARVNANSPVAAAQQIKLDSV